MISDKYLLYYIIKQLMLSWNKSLITIGPANWSVPPSPSAQASCTPDIEYVIAVASHIVQSVFDHNQKWIVIFISCCEGPGIPSHPMPLSGWWVPYDKVRKVCFYKNTFETWVIIEIIYGRQGMFWLNFTTSGVGFYLIPSSNVIW